MSAVTQERLQPWDTAVVEVEPVAGVTQNGEQALGVGRELAALFDGALHPVTVLRNGRLVYGNPAFCQWLGDELFRGRSLLDLLDAQDRPAAAQALEQPAAFPSFMWSKPDGRAVGASVMQLDCAGQVHTVVRLRELPQPSPARSPVASDSSSVDRPLWDLLQSARVGFWLVDARGRTMVCNPQAALILGTTVEELHASTLYDRLPVDGVGLPEGVHHVSAQREDGARIHLELSFSLFHDDDGVAAGALALIRDATAQHQMFAELHRSETRFRALLDTTPCAVLLLDASGGVHEVNVVAESMFGWTRPEWLRGTARAAALAESPEDASWFGERLQQQKTVHNQPVTLRRKDGSTFPARVSGTLFRDGEDERVALVILEDSVAQGLPPDLLVLRSQLVRHQLDLLRVVQGTVSTVQPALASIAGLLHLDGGERAQGHALRAGQLARRLGHTLDALAAYAGLAGAPSPTQVELRAVVQAALEEVRETVAQAGLEVVVDPGLPAVVGHGRLLASAVAKLLENCARFKSGQQVPRAVVGARVEQGVCTLSVEDNGCGLPATGLERLFELFGTLGHHAAEGAGLGLAMVRRVAELHGGRAWLEPAPGGGTRACMSFQSGGSVSPPP